ncbi:hypothetical protein RND71_016023 [Anisodus tanguticus]|uniref:Uncharacterized protein n=1 Tax=Anisodus tanguticus TaxID=243964 RepID=A0AAE1S701_9SOLA|nr:hypothetical protein RND71_016023 [Anisodus tanguticus]
MCLSVFRAFKWSGNTHYKDYATSYICFEPDFLGASLVIMFSQVAHDAQKGNKETIYVKILSSVLTPMREWSEKRVLSHHENFSRCNVGLMENILPVLFSALKILEEEVLGYTSAPFEKGEELRDAFAEMWEEEAARLKYFLVQLGLLVGCLAKVGHLNELGLTTIGILLSLTKWAKQIVAQPSDGVATNSNFGSELPDVCAVGSSGYPVELVKPLGHGFSRVEFASPDLFLRCNVEGKQHDTSCLLLLDKQNAESNDNHPCAKYHVEIDNTQKLYLILLLYQLLHQLFSSLLPRLDEIGSNVENANVATAQGRSQLAKLQRPKDQIHLRSQYILFRRRRGVKRLFKRCSHGQKRIVVHAPYVDIYVADSYFSKHDNLVDSKFEDFTAHDILSNACVSLQGNVKFAPKLTVLHQKLIGEGSHRRLSSSLRLKKSSESISSPPKSCEVIIVERLPSGVFADPFELQHLVQRGAYERVHVELVRNFAMSVSNKTRVLAVESIGQVPLLDALDSPMFESNAIARFRGVEL